MTTEAAAAVAAVEARGCAVLRSGSCHAAATAEDRAVGADVAKPADVDSGAEAATPAPALLVAPAAGPAKTPNPQITCPPPIRSRARVRLLPVSWQRVMLHVDV